MAGRSAWPSYSSPAALSTCVRLAADLNRVAESLAGSGESGGGLEPIAEEGGESADGAAPAGEQEEPAEKAKALGSA